MSYAKTEPDWVAYANDFVWKNPKVNLFEGRNDIEPDLVVRLVQELLIRRQTEGKLLLPNLTALQNDAVAIFSDYSGESTGKFLTYSVLICGYSYIWPFASLVKPIRAKYGLADREISFKKFAGSMRKALPEYLIALDRVPGFLCTVAVDKRLVSLFGPPTKATTIGVSKLLKENGLGDWKPPVAEKLLRITSLVAFLAALLTPDGQKIFWMTDNDAISPNEHKRTQMMNIFDRYLYSFARPGYTYPIIGGAVPFENKSLEMLDMLSVADIVSSSMEHYLTKLDTQPADKIFVKDGAEDVLSWLAHQGLGLKKESFVLKLRHDGKIESGTIEFKLAAPPKNAIKIEVAV